MEITYNVGTRILNTFQQFLQYYEVSSLACGVLIVKADLPDKNLSLLEEQLEEKLPKACAQFSYDASEGILGILLDDGDLNYTHHFASHVKSVLDEHNLLTGPLLIGSFPENGHHAEQMMFSMIWEQIVHETNHKDITFFRKTNRTTCMSR